MLYSAAGEKFYTQLSSVTSTWAKSYPTTLCDPSTWVKSYPTTFCAQVLGSNRTQLPSDPSTWVKSYPTTSVTQVLGSNHTQLHVVGSRSGPNPTFSLRTLDISQDEVSKTRGGVSYLGTPQLLGFVLICVYLTL